MSSGGREMAIARLVRLDDPCLQRMDLAAPWCAQIDGCSHPGMYVVDRGMACIAAFGEAVRLEAGDCALLPQGGGRHVVGDAFETAPLSLADLAARQEHRDEHYVRLSGTGPRTVLSAVPFRSPPLGWLPRILVFRRRDRDRVAQSLFEAYDRALEHGEPEVVARVAEALWIRSIAARIPDLDRLDTDVLRVAAMVHETPAALHTLHSLARAASLSRSRFSARFTAAFGEPPMRWVQRVRMDHAEQLLQGGTMSVPAVADVLGFSDESAFRKAYRRFRGRRARPGAR